MNDTPEKGRGTTGKGRPTDLSRGNRMAGWPDRFRTRPFSLRSQSIFAEGNRLIATPDRQTAERIGYFVNDGSGPKPRDGSGLK